MGTETRQAFKRRLRVGTTDTGYKSRAVVTIEIEWDGKRLGISGEERRPGASDIDGGGQMQDSIRRDLEAGHFQPARGWTRADIEHLLDLWDRWHLNDMRAGCEHQRAEGWDKRPIDPTKPTNAYGRHFEGQRSDSWNLLGWIRPDEHPDGLLTKPCPECGYRYGSAWQTEDVPTAVLDALLVIGEK